MSGIRPPEVIGRVREVEAARAALARGPVLLWGPPGIGTSTVLRAVAARWPGPVVHVPCRGLPGVEPVVAVVRRALDLAPDASLPRAFAARPGSLLALDDADGVADGLSAVQAAVGAGVAVLAAARRRGDDGTVVPVGPLSAEHAARLYLGAARRVAPEAKPDARAVRQLCRRLDGSPLAALAAGARARTLPPDHPALVSAMARSGPLASAVGQVVEALPVGERSALAAAAVFAGAFDAAAFERVTGAPAEVLEALLDGALVGWGEGGRLRLSPVLREWLREREPPEPAVAARHAAWVAAEGRERFVAWRRTGDPGPLEALRGDLEAAAAGGTAAAADAAMVLGELLLRRGPLRDPLAGIEVPAHRRVEAALLRARLFRRTLQHEAALALLDAAPAPTDPVAAVGVAMERAHHLAALRRHAEAAALLPALRGPVPSPEHAAEAALAAAVLLQREGRTEEAVSALRQGAALAEVVGLPELRARIGAHLGAMSRTLDPEAALRALEAALADYERLGDERWQGIVSQWLGLQHADAGAAERALDLLARSLRHCARAGAVPYEVQAHVYRCGVRLERGDLEAARQDLVLAERLGVMTPTAEASVRAHHGLLAHRGGEPRAALDHYRRALAAFERLGTRGAVATWSAFAALASAAVGGSPADDLARIEAVAGAGPGDALLARVVREAIGAGLAAPTRAAVAAGRRSDLRLLVTLADGAAVRVSRDGRVVVGRDGRVTSLASRAVLVRLLSALAAAGPGVSRARDELLAVGWPGETLVASSGQARLHVAISTLRRFGAPIVTRDADGELAYALDPAARVIET